MEYTTQAGRINLILGQMLKHAMHVEVLCRSGDMKTMPRNKGDTILYRRWLPYGASTANPEHNNINRPKVDPDEHRIAEGVTPRADDIQYHDVQTTVEQYGCAYQYTDKSAMLYEDNIPMHMVEQCGERMGLLKEMIAYGTLRACTNRFYASGVSGRETVYSRISLRDLRSIARNLRENRCQMLNRIITATANFNTRSIEPGWVVYCHTDLENDLRDMPGFVTTAEYSRFKPISPEEIGSDESFRFMLSPELAPYRGAGAATGNTGNLSSANGRLDVYPVIVIGRNAWADVALRGKSSMKPQHIHHSVVSKTDPLGQRGYVASSMWCAPFIQNDGWMAVLEVAVKDL